MQRWSGRIGILWADEDADNRPILSEDESLDARVAPSSWTTVRVEPSRLEREFCLLDDGTYRWFVFPEAYFTDVFQNVRKMSLNPSDLM